MNSTRKPLGIIADAYAAKTGIPKETLDRIRAEAANRYHVIPHPDGGWAVKRPLAKRVSRAGFQIRADACIWCWSRARQPSRVIVHDWDGTIDWIEEMPGDGPEEE